MDFGFGFGMFGVMFFIVFTIVIVMFILSFARTIKQWKKNNDSPRLTVYATVVDKIKDITYYDNPKTAIRSASSNYYVTFQVESGDRIALEVSREEYGIILEGDSGKLTFQGTRYISFER